MIKLELIKYDNGNCLEATWKEVTTTIQEVEKEIEVDGDELTTELVQEEVQTESVVACIAYDCSQMDLLKADAEKYKTDLVEYQELIELMESLVPEPDLEAIAKYELEQKIAEADWYLKQTDWVKDYKLRHDLELEVLSEDSSKWEVINKREEYIVFLKAIEGAK